MSGFNNPFAPKKSVSFSDAIHRIREWTRLAGAAGEDDIVSVNEIACAAEGCPPRETVILVMTKGQTRKAGIHKAMKDVTEADIAAAFAAPDRSNRDAGA